MKILFKISVLTLVLFSVFVVNSCSDEGPTNTQETQVEFSSYQIPGCNYPSPLGKISLQDSCFSYSFNDTLKIDFCVLGNCCPDSNRFVTDYKIYSKDELISGKWYKSTIYQETKIPSFFKSWLYVRKCLPIYGMLRFPSQHYS